MNGYAADFKKAYDAYYNPKNGKRIPYVEFRKICDDAVEAYATAILDSTPEEEIRKTWFKDYGTMNGWNWEAHFNYEVAYMLHQCDQDRNPQFHKMHNVNTIRGWHESKCKCGFGWSCDSSD